MGCVSRFFKAFPIHQLINDVRGIFRLASKMKVLSFLAAKVLNLDSTSQLFQKLCGSRTLAKTRI